VNAQSRRQSRKTYFVRAVALVCLIAGIAGLIGGVLLLQPDAHEATIAAMRLRTELGPEKNIAVIASVFRVAAVFLLLVGALSIAASYGLYRHKRFAQPLTLWLALILGFWWGMGALSVAMSPWRSYSALGWNVLGALVCGALVCVLMLPSVKRTLAQPLDMHAQRLRRKRTSRQ